MEELISSPDGHKAGFVNIIGRPNVGKSTLMNALVGERLSIITSKAQTTRHRIMGILNGEDFQIVYSDTPGIIEPKYALQKNMMSFVETSLEDADILLFMTEVGMEVQKVVEEQLPHWFEKIKNSPVPVFLVINKIDLSNPEALSEKVEAWRAYFPPERIIPVSALERFNVDNLLKLLVEALPTSPPYFPKDELTNKSERFFAAEIIREKIFLNYAKEIPYACEVVIESFKEEEKIIRVRAEILVERDTQKSIVIGKQGQKLKTVGIEARKDLEAFFGKQIFLEQYVKVEPKWRRSKDKLRRLGYHQ